MSLAYLFGRTTNKEGPILGTRTEVAGRGSVRKESNFFYNFLPHEFHEVWGHVISHLTLWRHYPFNLSNLRNVSDEALVNYLDAFLRNLAFWRSKSLLGEIKDVFFFFFNLTLFWMTVKGCTSKRWTQLIDYQEKKKISIYPLCDGSYEDQA